MTFKIRTLGCKVNQYESQAIRELFINQGFREIDDGLNVDVYIINSCTVTNSSDTKTLRLVGRLARTNSVEKIIVTGCFVQDEENIDRLRKLSLPNLLIAKNSMKPLLAHLVMANAQDSDEACEWQLKISDFKNHSRAFLKIQNGCDNNCSYCKIPFVRGRSRSRNPKEILKEVKRLIERGFREIVLCGVCLGAFGKDLIPKLELSDLIEELEKINADFRIRLSSIEAFDVNLRLIKKLGGSPKLCKHLHIPFQSGDDKILSLMNRGLRVVDYTRLCEAIRERVPYCAITSDIIVGFPGEEEENFQNTLRFIRQIRPSRLHIFPYSPRSGTRSLFLVNRPRQKLVKQRMQELNALAKEVSYEYRQLFVSQILTILVESTLDKKTGLLAGYTDNYIRVIFEGGEGLKNNFSPVRITEVTKYCTKGQMKP